LNLCPIRPVLLTRTILGESQQDGVSKRIVTAAFWTDQDNLDGYGDILKCAGDIAPGSSVFNNRSDLASPTSYFASDRPGESDNASELCHDVGFGIQELVPDNLHTERILSSVIPSIPTITTQSSSNFTPYIPSSFPQYVFDAHPGSMITPARLPLSTQLSEWSSTAKYFLFNPMNDLFRTHLLQVSHPQCLSIHLQHHIQILHWKNRTTLFILSDKIYSNLISQ